MVLHTAFGLEVLHLGILLGILAGLLGALLLHVHKHGFDLESGWPWIAAGLSVITLQAAIAVVDTIFELGGLPGGLGRDGILEALVLPIAALASVGYGLARLIAQPSSSAGARRELEQANRRLDQLIENTPAVIYTCEPEPPYELTWLGENTRHVLGVPSAALTEEADSWLEHIHPDDRDDLRAALEELASSPEGRTIEHDYRFRHGDEERWLHEAIRLLRDEDGNAVKLIASAIDITDRVEAEQALAESERRFRQITENMAATAWLATLEDDPAESEILYMSPGFEEMFGIPGEVIRDNPMAFLDRVHEEDVDDVWAEMTPDGTGDRSFEVEYRIRRDDGTVRHLRTRGEPILDEDGEPYRIAGISDDITARVEAKREVERERDLRAVLFEENTDAIVEFNFDEEGYSTIRAVNDSFQTIFGYDEAEVVGRRAVDVLVPEEDIEEHEGFNRRILAGEPVITEIERVTADGRRKFRLQAIPVQIEGADPRGYAWFTDLTRLRKLEREEALKARMLDQVGQAVIATDDDGRVTYWNNHAEEMYGWQADEAIGRPIDDLTVPDTPEGQRVAEEIMGSLAAGETWTGEFEAQRKDGSTFPALVSDAPIEDDEGEFIGVIGVSQDITEIEENKRRLAATTNELQARNRELRELSQATAHGFRTPIWDTTRYLELLEREAGEKLDETEHEYLQTALEGAHRLHDLVESLQAYLDAATREPKTGPTDAGDVLDLVLLDLADEIDATGAQIEVRGPAPELAIGSGTLAEAFSHVIENALRFSGDEPPRVEIGFRRRDEVWIISVTDHGIGIDPQYQERIFRPFRTLHGPEKGGGAGLGLALCRGIVESHGGMMWVRSEPGEGTTVFMTVPAAGEVVEDPGAHGPAVSSEAEDVPLFEGPSG